MQPPSLELLPNTALVIGAERMADTSGGDAEHIYAATGRLLSASHWRARQRSTRRLSAATEGAKACGVSRLSVVGTPCSPSPD